MSLRRDLKIAERRQDVAQMYLAGHTQAEIAHKWRVTQQQISLDLKWIHADWIESARMSMDEAKARELARINRLEREYWQAWQRSIGQRERTLTERTTGQSAYERAQILKENSNGDPRYLEGVRWCIEQRLKIFGPKPIGESESAIPQVEIVRSNLFGKLVAIAIEGPADSVP